MPYSKYTYPTKLASELKEPELTKETLKIFHIEEADAVDASTAEVISFVNFLDSIESEYKNKYTFLLANPDDSQGVTFYAYLGFVFIVDSVRQVIHRYRAEELTQLESLQYSSLNKFTREFHESLWVEGAENVWQEIDPGLVETLLESKEIDFGVFSSTHADEITTFFNAVLTESIDPETGLTRVEVTKDPAFETFLKEEYQDPASLKIFNQKIHYIVDTHNKNEIVEVVLTQAHIDVIFSEAILQAQSGIPGWITSMTKEDQRQSVYSNSMFVFVTSKLAFIDGNISANVNGTLKMISDATNISYVSCLDATDLDASLSSVNTDMLSALALISRVGNIASLRDEIEKISTDNLALPDLNLDNEIVDFEQISQSIVGLKDYYKNVLEVLTTEDRTLNLPQENIDRINAASLAISSAIEEILQLERNISMSQTIRFNVDHKYYMYSYNLRVTSFVSKFCFALTRVSLSKRAEGEEVHPKYAGYKAAADALRDQLQVVVDSSGVSGELNWLPMETVVDLLASYVTFSSQLEMASDMSQVIAAVRNQNARLLNQLSGEMSILPSGNNGCVDVQLNRSEITDQKKEILAMSAEISALLGE